MLRVFPESSTTEVHMINQLINKDSLGRLSLALTVHMIICEAIFIQRLIVITHI
jgi:hypothetical protein